jgi:hypothetical protein
MDPDTRQEDVMHGIRDMPGDITKLSVDAIVPQWSRLA